MGVNFNKNGIIQCDGDMADENLLLLNARSYTPTAYRGYQLNLQRSLLANQIYTMQLWDVNVAHSGKTESQLGIGVYWGGGTIRLKTLIGTNYFTNGHADYLCFTFTPTEENVSHAHAANLWLAIYNSPTGADGTRNMEIDKWKFEVGDKPTFWVPDNSFDNVSHGIIEDNTIMKLYPSYIQATDFIEY